MEAARLDFLISPVSLSKQSSAHGEDSPESGNWRWISGTEIENQISLIDGIK
jgi:hypothetical protein